MTSFPPLLPADGSLSNEMHLLQGAGHKAAFYNRPSDQRFFAEFIGDETEESVLPRIYEFWLRKLGMSADFHRRIVTPQEIGEYVSAAITNQAWRVQILTIDASLDFNMACSFGGLRGEMAAGHQNDELDH